MKKSTKAALLAALGSGFEYYDFVVYGMMAKYLSLIFFPSNDAAVSMMQTFSIFALGYIVRPLGGLIGGIFADKYGRKKAFLLVTLTMAFASLAIGLIPTYETVGLIAPVLLIVCRILQGLSFGAELPGATTIVTEFSNDSNIGKYTGLMLSSTSLGSLFAVLVLTFLSMFYTTEEIVALQAWRIPFIIGGCLAIVSYYIRNNLSETPEFLEYKHCYIDDKNEMFFELKKNIGKIVASIGLTFFLATLIIINIYFPAFISKYFNYSLAEIYQAMSIGMIFSFLSMLLFGLFSDLIDKSKMLLSSLFGGIIMIPILYKILQQSNYMSLVVFFVFYQFLISAYFVSYLPIMSKLFPVHIRYTATAISYNVAFSMASMIPTICSYFYLKNESPFFLAHFFILAIAVAFVSRIFPQSRAAAPYKR